MSSTDLAASYQRLSTEQLTSIISSGESVYRAEAIAAARVELQRRGLNVDALPSIPPAVPTAPGSHRRYAAAASVAIVGALVLGLGALRKEGSHPERDDPACDPLDFVACSRACDRGAAEACFFAGISLQSGIGAKKNLVDALKRFERACDLGRAKGCTVAGQLLAYDAVPRSPEQARALFRRSCDLGDQEACVSLGYQLINGEGGPLDQTAGRQLFEVACERKNGQGCTRLAYLFEDGTGVPKDLTKAAELYQRGCDHGSSLGCRGYAVLQRDGRGVARDSGAAKKELERLCREGDVRQACADVGMPDPFAKAETERRASAVSYERDCDAGSIVACLQFAECLKIGIGVERDMDRAVAYAQRACDAKLARACYVLGHIFRDGAGFGLDPAKAHQHFVDACMLGDDLACRWLKQPW